MLSDERYKKSVDEKEGNRNEKNWKSQTRAVGLYDEG